LIRYIEPSPVLYEATSLFHRDKSVISRHISTFFEEGELSPDLVVANYATTASDGNVIVNGWAIKKLMKGMASIPSDPV
jgi:hypothetical protein